MSRKKLFLLHIVFSLFFSALVSIHSQAEIYVWTDENGNKVFGDEPQKSDQAKPVELSPTTVLNFPKQDLPTTDTAQPLAPTSYSVFLITSPSDDATIRDNAGNVTVSLSSEPALVEGHKIQLYLNGAAYQSAQASLSFTLDNVDRGTHTVSANLLSETGATLMQTKAITFHLHRVAIKK